MRLTDTYLLSNGVRIPCLGFGTWQTPDGVTAVQAVKAAIAAGYRHIDTAAIYGNEKSVGVGIREGLKETGLERQDLFVTSKVWITEMGYDKTKAAFAKTLNDLQLDYLDLYLIHWPADPCRDAEWEKTNRETWRAMTDLYREGKIRAIGLSNFHIQHMNTLMDMEVKPMVNQIEFHPGQMQRETVAFCRHYQMVVEAWGPLGTGRMLSNEYLAEMAAKYNRSVAQLCIRWELQNGVLPLPKSVTPERIVQNTHVFDFEISAEDMEALNALPYIGGSGLEPEAFFG